MRTIEVLSDPRYLWSASFRGLFVELSKKGKSLWDRNTGISIGLGSKAPGVFRVIDRLVQHNLFGFIGFDVYVKLLAGLQFRMGCIK